MLIHLEKRSTKQGFADLSWLTLRLIDRTLRRRRFRDDLAQARNILVLLYTKFLGTCIHETPLFEAIKKMKPGCRVAVAASGVSLETVQNNPFIDVLWNTPSPDENLLAACCSLRAAIRASDFIPDCVLLDSNQQFKTVALAYLAGPYCRAGFATRPALLDKTLKYDPESSVIDNALKLLSLFGHESPSVEPRVFFTESHRLRAAKIVEMRDAEARPLVALVTQESGKAPARAWFDDRFVDLGDRLYDSLGCDVVFVGAPKDVSAIDQIRRRMKSPSFSAAGNTDVPTLAALLALCDYGISIDTGPMHLARAVRLPTVLIASAREPSHIWLPRNQFNILTLRRDNIECRDCHRSVCETKKCMDEIGVDDVIAQMRRLMLAFPATRISRDQRLRAGTSSAFDMIIPRLQRQSG